MSHEDSEGPLVYQQCGHHGWCNCQLIADMGESCTYQPEVKRLKQLNNIGRSNSHWKRQPPLEEATPIGRSTLIGRSNPHRKKQPPSEEATPIGRSNPHWERRVGIVMVPLQSSGRAGVFHPMEVYWSLKFVVILCYTMLYHAILCYIVILCYTALYIYFTG